MNLPSYILRRSTPSTKEEHRVLRQLDVLCERLLEYDYLSLDAALAKLGTDGTDLIRRALRQTWGRKLHELRFKRYPDDWRLFIHYWNATGGKRITMPNHAVDDMVSRLVAGAQFDFEHPLAEHAEMVLDAIRSAQQWMANRRTASPVRACE